MGRIRGQPAAARETGAPCRRRAPAPNFAVDESLAASHGIYLAMVAFSLADEHRVELIARAAAGDETAFERIVGAYHLDMLRVAFVVCRDTELADDACQQAWQIAWRKLSTVREPTRLRSWLVAIAANEARKLTAKRRHRQIVEATVRPIRVTSDDPGEDIDLLDLESALGRLKDDDRVLLALRYRAGLDATEIANIRGVSPSGVRARISRLLLRLRQELNDA